jgi:hypothetical protein
MSMLMSGWHMSVAGVWIFHTLPFNYIISLSISQLFNERYTRPRFLGRGTLFLQRSPGAGTGGFDAGETTDCKTRATERSPYRPASRRS